MGKHVVRLGDPTSHGGTVVSAAGNYSIMGKPVARMGDKCTCPLPGHSNCVIVEGDPTWTIDGRHVALEGHKLSCGGVVLSTLGNLDRSYEGSGSSSHAGAASQVATIAPSNVVANTAGTTDFNEHFVILDDRTGEPVDVVAYLIESASGATQSGMCGADGKTNLVCTDASEDVTLRIGQTRVSIG